MSDTPDRRHPGAPSEDLLRVDLVDLSHVQGGTTRAVLVLGPLDIHGGCKIADHVVPGLTAYDQVMSAVASIMNAAPRGMFREVATGCVCEDQLTPMRAQAISFLGMTGALCIAKEINGKNKSYVSKRWSAYCSGNGVQTLLTDVQMEALVRLVVDVQGRLHQTDMGKQIVQWVINHPDMQPSGMRDQVMLVYTHAGMKAASLMYAYINLAPIVLALPAVREEAVAFKAAYESLKDKLGEQFPYARLLGRANLLNHASYPDLYFCATYHYTESGTLGAPGNFIRTNVTTQTSTKVLTKYCRLSAESAGLTEQHVTAWREAEEGLGLTVTDGDAQDVIRRLKRKSRDEEDDE